MVITIYNIVQTFAIFETDMIIIYYLVYLIIIIINYII